MAVQKLTVPGKVEILTRLEDAYSRLETTLAPLSWAQMVEPGVAGYWSVKDIIAHLIFWNQHPVNEVQAALSDEMYEFDHSRDIDLINGEAVLVYRDSSIEEALDAFRDSYQAVRDTISSLPDSAFESDADITGLLGDTIHGTFADNTYEHYALHLDQIQSWVTRTKVG